MCAAYWKQTFFSLITFQLCHFHLWQMLQTEAWTIILMFEVIMINSFAAIKCWLSLKQILSNLNEILH